jgi:hypothetical protein
MSAADQRMAELLEHWMASVELHARYLELDDAAYAQAQHWPPHKRPTRWIVELARARMQELQRLMIEHQSRGDRSFAEALELMAFLAGLIGTGRVERFIPLVEPRPAEPQMQAPRREPRRPAPPAVPVAQQPRPAAPATDAAPHVSDRARATVIADAARLISWGREWPQLAGLIARLADRPPEAEVWNILRRHRTEIEAQARKPRA